MTAPELNNGGEIDAEGLLEGTTPEPWELRGPTQVYGNLQYDQNGTGDRVAVTVEAADARLIAAAPRLARQTIADKARIAALEAALTEVMPYLEEGYMDDEQDDEPIGWMSDRDGTNQRPVALTFGMIRRARAALSKGAAPCQ